MFPSRLAIVAVALSFIATQCQAKPLSFDGVQAGQQWKPFLKEHPKAELFWPSDAEMELSKAQQLQRASKRREALLVETLEDQQLESAIYFFGDHSLAEVVRVTDLNARGAVSKGLVELKPSLQKIISELGAPTEQGMTEPNRPISGWRQTLLVWRTPTQCAFARISWPLAKEPVPTSVELHLVDARWRTAKPGFVTIWPAVLPPTPQDEIKRRELFALLEELKPHSTQKIKRLTPAPAIDLSRPVIKNKADQTPKSGVPTLKPTR